MFNISSKNTKDNNKSKNKYRYVAYDDLDINYDILNDKEKKIAKNPNMYRKNAELISICLPGIGLVYLGNKIQGIAIFIVFVILIFALLKVSYGKWIIAIVYIAQLLFTVFSAYSQINKVLLKSSK
ncbi:hypothetical protein BGI41_08020 [Methanobrevibacter sp. 87.7]|uniref:hypothetical protein n=1 Tax=Methanobrevibacter sp. 87.7 TaxID=387957 RepID=UPI000B5049D7|nr:hypothetical protein [Methanobrevibacter sp. 87.7]OWT32368.1 hypothetical protein BGI41_08020 [Methanobrevibacter sp. 87.7]